MTKRRLSIIKFVKKYYCEIPFRVICMVRKMHRTKSQVMKIYYHNKLIKKYGCDISANCVIGNNFILRHVVGVVIGDGVSIGENCQIYQGVTLGQKNGKCPQIGNNVIIYSGATIVGDVTIGDNVIIGANSLVLKDVPSNTIVGGNPCKIIGKC